ncbi:pyruvate kinase [Candidatus Nitrosacidococcus sp. I8]|uniref:pyruvate kinase n=1 Tax=Candidatus Nitrosacidococcus sp. I8 TaxID=2942908 RepID=UPI0022261113|nr:pyruvate kinase [Candidatus Nitrosacidococcus sp. I8]CAH9018552.1 Pyruvate kinase [Candidatus Nitrosacidococcus sp. I8]
MSSSLFSFEKDFRSCRIICTLGPASYSESIIEKMVLSGMNVARLNFSHGTYEDHQKTAEIIRKVSQNLGRPVAILQDLQGHKIRAGHVQNQESIPLRKGQTICLGHGEIVSDQRIGIDYERIARQVSIGESIYLDDGAIELKVLSIDGEDITCQVSLGGDLKSRKGVVFPDTHLDFPLIDEKDNADAQFGVSLNVDMVAMSFVRSDVEIVEMRKRLAAWGKQDAFIVAKIEDREGLGNLDKILKVVDGILIARGDLGVMLPREKIPGIQKKMIQQVNAAGIPVITATQMLESMTYNNKPTRAEVTDVHDAVMSGSDAVMLSGETAAGSYPVYAVQEMDRIVREAEKELHSTKREIPIYEQQTTRDKVAASVVNLAYNTDARCILAFSATGKTIQSLAAVRSRTPVYGVVGEEQLLRRLMLYRGHSMIAIPEEKELDHLIPPTFEQLKEKGIIQPGDSVVVVARQEKAGMQTSYLIKLHVLG